MARTRVKFCGITCAEDMHAAVQAGADAIGLVFHPDSARAVSDTQASLIVASKPAWVTIVGLFVDAEASVVEKVLAAVPLDVLQFHGSESADYCSQFGIPWMKALAMAPDRDIAALADAYRDASAILLDTWKAGQTGGTGEVFDWSRVPESLAAPLVLAGGLNPGNVGAAIRSVRPYAVDVSGGIEIAPGEKSPAQMQAFIAAARAVDAELEDSANPKQFVTR